MLLGFEILNNIVKCMFRMKILFNNNRNFGWFSRVIVGYFVFIGFFFDFRKWLRLVMVFKIFLWFRIIFLGLLVVLLVYMIVEILDVFGGVKLWIFFVFWILSEVRVSYY